MEISNNTFAIITIVVAMGLIGVVTVYVLTELQNVDAKGCPSSIAVNASKGRCFQP